MYGVAQPAQAIEGEESRAGLVIHALSAKSDSTNSTARVRVDRSLQGR